jgi:hypothetical protein
VVLRGLVAKHARFLQKGAGCEIGRLGGAVEVRLLRDRLLDNPGDNRLVLLRNRGVGSLLLSISFVADMKLLKIYFLVYF